MASFALREDLTSSNLPSADAKKLLGEWEQAEVLTRDCDSPVT